MDTIANMLTSIKNAQAVSKQTVSIPYSKFKMAIAEIFVKEKFLKEAEHRGKKIKKAIDITLGYDDSGRPAINGIKRISKPSKRVYVQAGKIKTVKQGFGTQIISTPMGIMTGKQAKEKKVGGEVVCEIW